MPVLKIRFTKRETEDILMDKKPSNVKFVIRLTIILAFFAIALFPMCLMAMDGPDEAKAEMQEDTVHLVAPTLSKYWTGEFQKTFDSWISKYYPLRSKYYPLRSKIVSAFRQMQMDVENSNPIVGIMNALKGVTATDDTICEMHRDDDFNGLCDVCSTKLYDVPVVPDDDGSGDGGEGEGEGEGNTPTTPRPPVNVYLDPNNIYSQINRLQLLYGTPKEPTGFKGNSGIAIGKSGYLFEIPYMQEYLGVYQAPPHELPYTQVTDEGLQEMVNRFEYIQTELKKRGIEMLYVITPSKASAYADYIPDHYKNSVTTKPGYVRPIERLRTMLANSSINYLDSAKYYEEIGLLVTFPKTGIHWNALASFESTAKLVNMYQKLTGEQTVTLYAKGVKSFTTPPSSVNPEQDIFNLLYDAVDPKYREEAIKDAAYYSPDIGISNTDAKKLNVLVHGGSFAHSIVHYLRDYGVANVTQSWYNDWTTYNPGGPDPRTEGPEAWGALLEGKDLVIFEATEQQIRGGHKTDAMSWQVAFEDHGNHLGHNAMYDSLYEYLKAHEGEY